MKKSLAIFSILVWALSMSAQTSINPPRWMKRLPKSPARAMYVYKVTSGEAYTYEEAYSKAFAKAILEWRWEHGIEVDVNATDESLAADILQSTSVRQSEMRLSIYKACEYVANSRSNNNVIVTILWQVPKYGNVAPDYKTYMRCR